MSSQYDAAVVGSGPNGLAAAITLAEAGRSVVVYEAAETIGGGTRTEELTLPGYLHDVCSAIHPLAVVSPFFRRQPLSQYGLEWIHPPAPLAHPLDEGEAILVHRDVGETAAGLGVDGPAYERLMSPLVAHWEELLESILGPFRPPRHPILMARFGLQAIRSASGLATGRFRGEPARALFAGMAAHSIMPLETRLSAAFGVMMGVTAHAVGWPMTAGGSQGIARAMAERLASLGGQIVTGHLVDKLDDLPPAGATLFATSPRALISIAGEMLPEGYLRQLERYRYGPGVFKVDWALDGPVPWLAEAPHEAATVHVGGTLEEIAASESAVGRGKHPERPFVIFVQQTPFDPSRAPEGKHTAWGYCHVPNGSAVDMTERIEAQIERFAPGFKERILARHTRNAQQMGAYNANYVGGDINVGIQDLRQAFTRPAARPSPYTTPVRDLYLCSSATPPGGGVHGMCGYHAARVALLRS